MADLEAILARLERRVLEVGRVGGWLKSVDTLRTLLARESPDIRNIVLALVAPQVEQAALAAIRDAFGLGVDDALDVTGIERAELGRTGRPSKTTLATVKGIDRAGRDALKAAQALARAGAAPGDVLAPLFGHANSVRGRVTEGVNMAGNEGVTAVADAADLPTVWVAETNACVHCLAYSGRVAKPGGTFPGGLTYGRKSYHPKPLKHPPLHPRCRCTVEVLNDASYAEALRREADRSVLRGLSLESESMGTRLDAAQRLIESGVEAPKTVIAYAERSIKAGEFSTRGRPGK